MADRVFHFPIWHPFVQVSREKYRKQVRTELEAIGVTPTEDKVNKIAEIRVKEEINRGVQMIQYQVITLMTTNGQAPFITVFMYLDEVPEGQLRDDLAAGDRGDAPSENPWCKE